MSSEDTQPTATFIHRIIDKDLEAKKNNGKVVTRFPPEPNGYLHIGHAKSICLNFGIAETYHGQCNLRFDDTNPVKEDIKYAQAIEEDVRWLGFKWDSLCHTSNYFDQLYDYAHNLTKQGKAYVDSQSAEEMRNNRGTLTSPGQDSPYRDRSIEENLQLLEAMRDGQYPDSTHVLRAKIDMASPVMALRDPTIYRIRQVSHHATGDKWCIYPMYDFAHCLSDAIEGITHSLCTNEFKANRPLYDWFLDNLPVASHPQQIEFGRLNFEYTVVSKRKLSELIEHGSVDDWDDPRMPTLAGMRRRGYSAQSIRDFSDRIGVTKNDGIVEMAMLESCVRDDLNNNANRVMAVLHPLKVIIESYPVDAEEILTVANHPNQPERGERGLPFTREIYIDRNDFAEVPPPKFKRLIPGGEVRLRHSYVIKCNEIIKSSDGSIIELRCSHDPDTLGKKPEGRKVKGVIHWVSAKQAIDAEVRLYDRLFNVPNPAAQENFLDHINPKSLVTLHNCKLEPGLSNPPEAGVQFEREGYFCFDQKASTNKQLTFNRIVTLRDTWSKITAKK